MIPDCAICGHDEPNPDRLAAIPGVPEITYHYGCIGTVEGAIWKEEIVSRHPQAGRYWALITQRHPVRCQACGLWQGLSPTASGFDPSGWDANCNQCFRSATVLSAYEQRGLYGTLTNLRERFKRGEWSNDDEAALEAFADAHDWPQCTCGGWFTPVARPRCRRCTTQLSDSFFSFVSATRPFTQEWSVVPEAPAVDVPAVDARRTGSAADLP